MHCLVCSEIDLSFLYTDQLGLLLTMPYGALADRIGRKPVFLLSLIGIILSSCWMLIISWFWQVFPLRLIWLAPIFQAVGGGTVVAVTMIFTMVSDVVTQEDRFVCQAYICIIN